MLRDAAHWDSRRSSFLRGSGLRKSFLKKRNKEDAVVNIKGQGLDMQYTEVTVKDLLEAGAHFGHQKHRWNPKMKRFIFEQRNGIYIIDLAKTMQQIRNAKEVVKDVIAKKKSILFVGTKKQAKIVIKE